MQKRQLNRQCLTIAAVIAAISSYALSATAQTAPALINYQGKLTDQTGAPLPTGTYGIQFRIWDDATASGTNDLIWGQQQNVTIQSNGVFNVILGAPGGSPIPGATPAVNSLAYAFAGSNCFLGVTVVAQTGTNLSAPSEILPRQQFLSVPFAISAANAGTAVSAATALSVRPGSITSASLIAASIQTTNLADGAVTLAKLAPRPVGTNVPLGGLAISLSSGNFSAPSLNVDVSNLSVTLQTSGRPVFLGLIPDGNTNNLSFLESYRAAYDTDSSFGFTRDSVVISAAELFYYAAVPTACDIEIPPGSISFIDVPSAGTHTYTLRVLSFDTSCSVKYVKLVAYEF
jgi:hypothetical protein